MGNVLRADFSPWFVPTEADIREVIQLGRRAAALLGRETGLSIRVSRSADRRFVDAQVDGTYTLAVTVGAYAEGILVDVTADVEWLRDQSLATEGDFGSERACPTAPSVEAAVAWVKENCLPEPVERVPPAEMARWCKIPVEIPAPAGIEGTREVHLIEAVKIYGAVYGRRISPDLLEVEQGIPAGHAAAISAAVRRILPKVGGG